jgi:cell division protein FtsB
MELLAEIRRRAWQIIPQVIAACLLIYFSYHAVEGDRGVLAYLQLEKDLRAAEAEQMKTAAERQDWTHRVSLLKSDSIDPDMLEERARRVLNYGREDELVIFYDEN